MDGQRFDDLAIRLAAGITRRGVLKTLGGGLVGGLLVTGRERADAYVCRQAGATCLKDALCCSGDCDQQTHRCNCPNGLIRQGRDCVCPDPCYSLRGIAGQLLCLSQHGITGACSPDGECMAGWGCVYEGDCRKLCSAA